MLTDDNIHTIWIKWLSVKERMALSAVNLLFRRIKRELGWLRILTVKPVRSKFIGILHDIDYTYLLNKHYRSLYELNVYNSIDNINRMKINLPPIVRIIHNQELFPIVINPVNISHTQSISIVSNNKDSVNIYVEWVKFPFLRKIDIFAYDISVSFTKTIPKYIRTNLLLKNPDTLCCNINHPKLHFVISDYII